MTDAGTPAVSDPGADLVAAWAAEGGRVVPIPGASAVLAAVVAVGVAGPRWAFEGFLPRSGRERQERLRRIAADDRGTVVFEAPGGSRRRCAISPRPAAASDRAPSVANSPSCTRRSSAARSPALAEAAAAGAIPPRGEFALVVGSWPDGRPVSAKRKRDALEAARRPSSGWWPPGTARGDAARQVAAETGIARRQLYGADRVR